MLVFGTCYGASVPLDNDRTLLNAKVVQETPTGDIIKARVKNGTTNDSTVETWIIRMSDRKTICTIWEFYDNEGKFKSSMEVNLDRSSKTEQISKIINYIEDKD